MSGDIAQLHSEVETLQRERNAERVELEAKLQEITARTDRLEATLHGLRQSDADSGVQMEKVIAELQILRGELEQARHLLGETRSELGETQNSVKEVLDRPPMEVQAAEKAPDIDAPPVEQVGEVPVPDNGQALYDLGKKFFDEKNFPDAIVAFDLFTERHSGETELLDNAYFWAGEAHYELARKKKGKDSKTEYKRAILAYQKVLETKGANKADGALLKIGLAFEQLGFVEEAKVFYEEIQAKYPKSSLVPEAKKRLKNLKRRKKKKR